MTPEQRAKKAFEGKDDKYVKDIYISCRHAVDQDCFSTRDVIYEVMAETELYRRGYTITSVKPEIKIRKAS